MLSSSKPAHQFDSAFDATSIELRESSGGKYLGVIFIVTGTSREQLDALYHSVTQKLFTLPDEVLVYPAHDYQDRRVSSIGQEKRRNPRLGHGRTLAEFQAIMAGLNLPYPTFIDYAVPGNRSCGQCPDDLPEQMLKYCGRMGESVQG